MECNRYFKCNILWLAVLFVVLVVVNFCISLIQYKNIVNELRNISYFISEVFSK